MWNGRKYIEIQKPLLCLAVLLVRASEDFLYTLVNYIIPYFNTFRTARHRQISDIVGPRSASCDAVGCAVAWGGSLSCEVGHGNLLEVEHFSQDMYVMNCSLVEQTGLRPILERLFRVCLQVF